MTWAKEEAEAFAHALQQAGFPAAEWQAGIPGPGWHRAALPGKQLDVLVQHENRLDEDFENWEWLVRPAGAARYYTPAQVRLWWDGGRWGDGHTMKQENEWFLENVTALQAKLARIGPVGATDELDAVVEVMRLQLMSWWDGRGVPLSQMYRPEEQAAFRQRVAETIAWCRAKARPDDPAQSLRTLELRPGSLGGHGEANLPEKREHEVRRLEVSRIGFARKRLLGQAPQADIQPTLAGGRLVVYEPDTNLFDGAAQLASDGFFDVNNVPPWDTWLDYFPPTKEGTGKYSTDDHGKLVAWVPSPFLAAADIGIRVNPEDCIRWADQDNDIMGLLVERGWQVETNAPKPGWPQTFQEGERLLGRVMEDKKGESYAPLKTLAEARAAP
ncbi:MAG: hypothetical protein LC620_03805, partial [Halobacteriales archaeon]|nr:hypothetical protein [Halobacteriales archaeon]